MSQPAIQIRHPEPLAVLQLLKPITWFPPMWAFACGLVSSGVALADFRWSMLIAGVLLTGPLVCGTSQAVNDWYDRFVDAINEPDRPIPSGRVPGAWGFYIAVVWTAVSLIVSATLGVWGVAATVLGLALAWAYSAPPIRLKSNGWFGNAAVGLCYEGLPWFTGALVAGGGLPDTRIVMLALLYSVGAHGIMTLNDFKSVEGDIKMGVRSLPVQLGVSTAARLACVVMAVPQLVVIGLFVMWGRPAGALAIAAVLIIQAILMVRFLRAPRELAPWYNATGVSLYVTGMMISAVAIRHVIWGI
jgi:chlorophyll/bacteriochlorophyll a synthase